MSIGIYKIISPSRRVYIGQSVRVEVRFKYYKRLSCNEQSRLYASFIKYGVENHIFEIVELCDVEDLNKRERYWQDFYNCVGKRGLNCRLVKTNDKSGRLSDVTKSRIIKSNTGKKRTPELRALLSMYNKMGIIGHKGKKSTAETKLRIKESHKRPMLGHKHSDEIKLLIKNASINMWNIKGRKMVLDTIIGIYYESIEEASVVYSISINTLRGNLNGRHKSKRLSHLIYV